MNQKRTLYITQAAIIAAIYIVLLYIFSGTSFSAIQIRVAEALTILPYFTPAAIPGVTIGCLLGNLLLSSSPLDVIFGTLATLIGAIASYKLRHNKFLVPIPPIVANMLIIPWVIRYAAISEGISSDPIPFMMVTIGIGEIISVGILGMILLFALEKNKDYIFKYK